MNRRHITLLLAGLFSAYVFAGSIIALSYITGFSIDFPEYILPKITPSNNVLIFEWILHFTMMGVSLFFLWRDGNVQQHRTDAATALLFLQMAIAVIWPFANNALASSSASVSIMILYCLALFWAMIVTFRTSPIATFILIPVLAQGVIYVYYTIRTIQLNPGYQTFF